MNLTVNIRQERPDDHQWVVELTERAFETMPYSDGKEGRLVHNLRKSPFFIPELSLVAEYESRVVGHILFTPVIIDNGSQKFHSLLLGPVSVLPELQNQGIGSQLIKAGHQRAKDLGHHSVILVGHAEYYPRFGYKSCSTWNIKSTLALPSDDVFMAVELSEGALQGVNGTLILPPEFE
ncbi:MAG: GNAT family N-acetyltransferase [Methylococcaceae bacterium]|nr:N-acetyltransferase [Prolixibacteraceae bacterium]